MKRKWKDSRGETIIEALAAVLIGSLSVALLFGTVMASGDMEQNARVVDEAFNESLNKAEGQVRFVDSEVTVQSAYPGVPEVKLPVTVYGGDGALSYELKDGGEGP